MKAIRIPLDLDRLLVIMGGSARQGPTSTRNTSINHSSVPRAAQRIQGRATTAFSNTSVINVTPRLYISIRRRR